MGNYPIDKGLANDYRNTLGVADAPNFIDSEIPITPVVVINNGFEAPTTAQSFKTYTFNKTAAATTDVQISTVTSNKRVFLVGFEYFADAVNTSIIMADATSGTITLTDGATNQFGYTANITTQKFVLPKLLEVKTGLRLTIVNGAGVCRGTIYYVEIDKI